MMPYRVKELFYTLQGEGRHTGRPAVFCRFSGCNLWSGREQDRATARCQFCDTDFLGTDGLGGGTYQQAEDLALAIASTWRGGEGSHGRHFVVFTGGEPLLQLDESAIQAVGNEGFQVAIETNGTRLPPPGIDWICVSPKAGTELVLRSGDELKLIYPQLGAQPDQFVDLKFGSFYLQPMDGPDLARNTRLAIEYCLAHPRWRLSLQTHKFLGLR
ncbi:MAG: 7-carboxy-7-deazaguanine synthase [Gemmataceae bacterium]